MQLKLRCACFRWCVCVIVRYVDGVRLFGWRGIMRLEIIYQDIILFICYYVDKIILFFCMVWV